MKFSVKERDMDMKEYAIILTLVIIVVIAAVTIMVPLVGKVFSIITPSL